MSLHIRLLASALVFVVFAGGAAQAMPLPGSSLPAEEKAGFLDAAWDWVVAFFNSSAIQNQPSLGLGGSGDEGLLDPDSSTLDAVRKTDTEEGGMMDPDGLR
ncbi:MAG TPA: hypothetical protein VE685_26785 [Thermoanaerobaculia bacterium]|nr:hypothetical protein [Thermoanaerobaculia bacterium]